MVPSAPFAMPLLLLDPGAESAGLDPALLVGLVVFACLAVVAVVLVRLHLWLARARGLLEPLERLGSIEATVGRIAEERDRLDLRRLEHVLIDIRDGQRRLEERLIAVLESLTTREVVLSPSSPAGGARGGHVAERVTSRLLALGYERIEVLTPLEDLERLVDGEGEILVEAHRSGVSHKGRVILRDGGIADIRMREGYEAFP